MAHGQTTEDKFATLAPNGADVRWSIAAQYAEATLTVAAPDGQVFRKEFKSGAALYFNLSDEKGQRLADGQYTYEIRLTPAFSSETKRKLKAAREKGNDEEVAREMRKRGELPPAEGLVQSGAFTIMNGMVLDGSQKEELNPIAKAETRRRSISRARPLYEEGAIIPVRAMTTARPRPSASAFFDQVIPDDLIVQGSACVGIDCVNGENFGFDTIRVKENNTRIQFDDTSTTSGFPTNNWQIRANSSASGGDNFLAFVDQGATGTSETGTIVFQVDAGAPANSVRVASTGRVGFRTATPVLDLHTNTTNTPALRLEQNSSGGFSAQTWDVAGNEANFFVRDVTSGSRLPFRIRPGAPTSSIDIAANGDVGIGTASPLSKLHVAGKLNGDGVGSGNSAFADFGQLTVVATNEIGLQLGRSGVTSGAAVIQGAKAGVGPNDLSMQPSGGRVGIATLAPSDTLTVNGTASKPGGGSWSVFSDERLKNIKGRFTSGLRAVMQLQPLLFEYRSENALGLNSNGTHIGFGAQSVKKALPEAVTSTAQGYLMVNNDPIMWAMLNAIKEQQAQIEQLKAQVRQLQATSAGKRSRGRRR